MKKNINYEKKHKLFNSLSFCALILAFTFAITVVYIRSESGNLAHAKEIADIPVYETVRQNSDSDSNNLTHDNRYDINDGISYAINYAEVYEQTGDEGYELRDAEEYELIYDEDDELPYDSTWETGDRDVYTDYQVYRRISCWGDSMTEGASDYSYCEVNGLDISYATYPSVLEYFTGITTCNMGRSGDLSTDVLSRACEYIYQGDILILEMGSNGGWDDYDDLIGQYRYIIDSYDCSEFIIVGDTDNPGESIADTLQSCTDEDGNPIGLAETEWEKALSEAFGEHFINMRLYLIDNGLNIVGLETEDTDLEGYNYGRISDKLRSDWTHFNGYGYYAQAVGIYEK